MTTKQRKRPSLYATLILTCLIYILVQLLLDHQLSKDHQHSHVRTSKFPFQADERFVHATIGPKGLQKPSSPRYHYQRTNATMAACLFIMDDTIRLLEWLAYHYTVLPLSHLVVAIDPKSHSAKKIQAILDSYRPYMWIDVYTNDTWLTLKPEEGWGRQLYGPKGNIRTWFLDKEGDVFRAQNHKRRQNFFFSFCLQTLFKVGVRSWTILIDSDEFLVPNYRHPEAENASVYDAETSIISKQDLDVARNRILPIRERMPRFEDKVTIADFLQDYIMSLNATDKGEDIDKMSNAERKAYKVQAMKDHALETAGVKTDRPPRCLRLPHLRFSSYESNPAAINQSLPEGVNPTTLVTLRQRKVGPTESLFSKAMLDLSPAKSTEWFNFKGVVNVHTPSRRLCGRTSKKVGFSGSGADYMSALLRINHYRSGTIETYLERSGDYRGSSIWRFYAERNIQPVGDNDDIRPWITWYIDKIGRRHARRLLLDPLEQAYRDYQHHVAYADAKEVLERLQGNDPLEHGVERKIVRHNYTRTSTTMATCVLLRNDNIRFIEFLAYHFTVLPLGSVVVGIDSLSNQVDKIRATGERWKKLINVTVWSDDSWLKSVGEAEGFKVKLDPGNPPAWFLNRNSEEYQSQLEERRKRVFIGNCLSYHKSRGESWTVLLDVEEFIVFNYKGKQEIPLNYDSREENVRTKDDIIAARTASSPIRDRLPLLQDHVTVADFLASERIRNCIRMPGLEFGATEFDVQYQEPAARHLLTLIQRQFGRKQGTWTRTIVDLSAAKSVGWQQVANEHNCHLQLCGFNGKLDATDYISSLIRFHRHSVGSLETFVETQWGSDHKVTLKDYRNATDDFIPYGDDHETMLPWLDWYIAKVGGNLAKELLFDPLVKAYQEMEKIQPVMEREIEKAELANMDEE